MNKNKEDLVNYLVKDYCFINDEVEILIHQAVLTNIFRSVLSKRKTSYRIVKSGSVSDDTILVPDTQADTVEDNITANTIRHNKN